MSAAEHVQSSESQSTQDDSQTSQEPLDNEVDEGDDWNETQEQGDEGSASGESTTQENGTTSSEQDSEGQGPVGTGEYEIKQGECIESIAIENGLFWETIWDHARNAELKRIRKDAFVLLPGDKVHIPAIRVKEESGATEQRHTFRRRGVPSRLRVIIKRLDEPWANEQYRIDIDGEVRTGQTDDEGMIDEPISPDAKQATITMAPDTDEEQAYPFKLGGVDPVSETSGIQERLANLGFDCPQSGKLDDETRTAIGQFQEKHELEVTSKPNQATRDRLVQEHGS